MRLLSSVIKGHRAVVSSPVTIENDRPNGFYPELAETIKTEEAAQPAEPVVDVVDAERQVLEILQETEQMVKDLLAGAKEQAAEIILEAKAQVEIELADAERAKEDIHAKAHQTGYQAGYSVGKEAAYQELEQQIQEIAHKLSEAEEEKRKIIASAEQEIIQLAVAVAEKIIRSEVSSNPEVVKDIVRAALNKVTDREEVIIKVNPSDLDQVMSAQEELYAQTQGVSRFKIVSDPLISQGGCIVETPCGTVDGRLERQLSEIKEALLEVS